MEKWMAGAACSGYDPELWFPVSGIGPGARQTAQAKAVCGICPVRSDCLAYALRLGLEYGVFGGLSAADRRASVTSG